MMRCIYPAVMMKAALFDFGGVILSSPFEAFNSYELEAGLPHNTIRLLNSTNPDSNAWARFERGELDASGFVEVFQAEAADAGFEVDATRILGGTPRIDQAGDGQGSRGVWPAAVHRNAHQQLPRSGDGRT